MRSGDGRLCESGDWPDNQSCRNLVAWCWRTGENRCLVVVNLFPHCSQELISVPWDDLDGRAWRLHDIMSGDAFKRDGSGMLSQGTCRCRPGNINSISFIDKLHVTVWERRFTVERSGYAKGDYLVGAAVCHIIICDGRLKCATFLDRYSYGNCS
ncbi:MAG: hypothetical protein VB050_06960 [Geobacteraceae bacterium]|nr:hypothetical protein [Geobacteraceae bacterium]